jgi:hypothetical protein
MDIYRVSSHEIPRSGKITESSLSPGRGTALPRAANPSFGYAADVPRKRSTCVISPAWCRPDCRGERALTAEEIVHPFQDVISSKETWPRRYLFPLTRRLIVK